MHPRRHDALLQLRGNQTQSLGRLHELTIKLAAGEPGDLVARKHELANLAHGRVQNVDVNANRGVGQGSWPRIVRERPGVDSRNVDGGNVHARDGPDRGVVEDLADLLYDAVDVNVALCAGGFDRGQDLADGVDHVQQHIRRRLVHRSPAVTQLGQQALACVSHPLQPAERKETTRALDGVDRAEDPAQELARVGAQTALCKRAD